MQRQWEQALCELDARIASAPDAVSLRVGRAGLLVELGRTNEARDAYLDVLAHAPSHRLALNNLGTLLHSTGYRSAAQTAYAQAVAHHPNDAMSRVNLANVLYENGEFDVARQNYETALRTDPAHPEAHQGLAYVLTELGHTAAAAWHRRQGWQHRAVRTLRYRGQAPPVSILLLISTAGGNIPVRNFLDDRIFQTTILAAEFYDLRQPLPPHQLIFNVIGDADLSPAALVAAQALTALSGAPVLNLPSAVVRTRRVDNARRLSQIPGVITPATITLARESPTDLPFPLLLRSPGFHSGRYFEKVDSASHLAATGASLPGPELTAIQYLDYRSADGKFRKYRVMMIDGKLYPLHLAVSGHWKIHYITSDLAGNEDARFLDGMAAVLGPQAMTALAAIQQELALDYSGIDFALSPGGGIFLFEANATMVVNPPEPGPQWDYRRPAVDRVLQAIRQMLLKKAASAQIESAANSSTC